MAGLALAIAPRVTLQTIFGQPHFYDAAWLRLLGLQTMCLAMLMVLVGHRIQELWWWSWAFELTNVALSVLVVLNAAFGRAPGEPALLWWVFSLIALGFACAMLYGLFVASREQPLP